MMAAAVPGRARLCGEGVAAPADASGSGPGAQGPGSHSGTATGGDGERRRPPPPLTGTPRRGSSIRPATMGWIGVSRLRPVRLIIVGNRACADLADPDFRSAGPRCSRFVATAAWQGLPLRLRGSGPAGPARPHMAPGSVLHSSRPFQSCPARPGTSRPALVRLERTDSAQPPPAAHPPPAPFHGLSSRLGNRRRRGKTCRGRAQRLPGGRPGCLETCRGSSVPAGAAGSKAEADPSHRVFCPSVSLACFPHLCFRPTHPSCMAKQPEKSCLSHSTSSGERQ